MIIGALMHSRPKSFAKMIGELMFWVGEDKMTFGGDYNIWTPNWQGMLGLNAARLYDIPVPAELRLPDVTAGAVAAP